jgi:hypothetical protein
MSGFAGQQLLLLTVLAEHLALVEAAVFLVDSACTADENRAPSSDGAASVQPFFFFPEFHERTLPLANRATSTFLFVVATESAQ